MPISAFIMEMEARHGVYNRQKTKKDKTEAVDGKYTTLVERSMEEDISFVALKSIPLNMAMEETTTSFATKPAKSAETIAQLLNPSGSNTGAKNLPILSKILPLPSNTNWSLKVKEDKRKTMIFIAIIIEPTLTRKVLTLFLRMFLRRLNEVSLYGGNSKIKVWLSLFKIVLSKTSETKIATTTPSKYNPIMTKILLAPKNAPPMTV